MRTNNLHNKHLDTRLPRHLADEQLWVGIERHLNKEAAIKRLPEHKADPRMWEGIAFNLRKAEVRKLRRRVLTYASAIGGMAASVLLVVYLSAVRQVNEPGSVVVFSEELIDTTPRQLSSGTTAQTNFASYCTQFPDVCTSPEFSQLQIRWEQLKAELNRLRTLSAMDNNERLNLYMVRLEKDIQQLENRMMHMFM